MSGSLLQVRDLCAGYGASRVLDGVSFDIGVEAVAIIGRNGMGKTTLCDTIMGLVRATSGEVVFHDERIDNHAPEKIAKRGISYVPQGRRLFRSLTVDEHLTMLAKGTRGKRWTREAVYDLFPRLAERRRHGGAQLSGGEQQMLAVGAGIAAQRFAGGDGRAVGRARTHDRRHPDRGRAPTGGRGSRSARGRAEPARRHAHGRSPARDGVGSDRSRDAPPPN